MSPRIGSRSVALVVVVLLILGAAPGVAAAETRSGGTVVVEEGETVDGLTAYGGTVVVRGTVDGDLQAFAGNVLVEGEVTDDVEAFAGNVRIAGDVGGDVEAFAGNVFVDPGATIGGSIEAAAGNVVVAGTIEGDAALAGGTITLAETARIGGDLEYAVGDDGEFRDEGATIGGAVTREDDLEIGPSAGVPRAPAWAFDVYGFLVNLALWAILLFAFPGFSRRVAERVATEPLRTGGIGLLSLVAVPVVLVLLAITIVGIPLAIIGAFAFALVAWVSVVYGRYAVGAWLVSLADVDSRWAGLLVGMIAVALVKFVPILGGIVEFAVFLLGLGALATLGYGAYRRRRDTPMAEPADAEDPGTPAP